MRLFLLLLCMAGLLFFGQLRCPLLEPEEARYAEIPREMLAEGHFLVPVWHGRPYYHKPPLLYWLIMASYGLFGVHDWAARLVPAAAGVLTVLTTYLWGRRTLGHRAAFAGALILCLSARFLYFARMITCDGLLVLWVVAALGSAHTALWEQRLHRGWWLLSAALCGLAVLTKGPVALVLVLGPVLVFQFLGHWRAAINLRGWLAYGAAVLAVACPWYVLTAIQDPRFLGEFFWTHHVIRYLTPYDHAQPCWYYVPGLLLGMMPWTLLLPALMGFMGRRSAAASGCGRGAIGFYLLAFLICFLFFSVSGCKRAGYILPAFPPLALALGGYFDSVLPRPAGQPLSLAAALRAWRLARLTHQAALLILALGCAASLLAMVTGMCRPVSGLTLATLAALGLGGVWRFGRGRPLLVSGAVCAGVTFIVLLLSLHQLLPSYTRKFSLRGQVQPHFHLAQDPRLAVACYPHRWDSVSFYLRRNDVKVYSPERRKEWLADLQTRRDLLVFVKSDQPGEKVLTNFLASLPGELEFVPLGKRGQVMAGMIRPRGLGGDALFVQK